MFEGVGKAFCAGGDIMSIYKAKISNNKEEEKMMDTFFREEFLLDYLIKNMNPIQIAILDGFTMGGGVGISIHSKFRIATENSVFAMPGLKFFY